MTHTLTRHLPHVGRKRGGKKMKKTYIQPEMQIDKPQHIQMLCTSFTDVKSANTDVEINYGGEGTEPARTKESDGIWGDEEW